MLDEDEGVLQRVGGGQCGPGRFELLRDVHDDQGLILDDED